MIIKPDIKWLKGQTNASEKENALHIFTRKFVTF